MIKMRFFGFLLLMFFSLPLVAQTTNVTGRITDEKGELMIGVSVMEKGTTNGAVTDINGTYNIKVSSKSAVIVVSYIGYETQEKKLTGTVLDFTLKENVNILNDVQVVGYGVQRRVSIVGAQSTLKMEHVKAPVSNMSNVLAGRVSGLVAVQRTGVPGQDDSDIWIRGISSMTNTNQGPLVLVDGIERDYKRLDPEDIESVTILKDASSTAVYGVRGGNGVIIITTKPGIVSKPKFSVDYYEGFTMLTQVPKLVDAYQYMDAANEAYRNTYDMNYYSEQYINNTKMADGLIAHSGDATVNKYLYPNVDWMDALYNKFGKNRRANINVRGGAPNASYYVSLAYYDETGLTKTDPNQAYSTAITYNRYNFLNNVTLKASKKTTIDVGVNGYFAGGNYPLKSLGDIYAKAMNINPVMYPIEYEDGSNPGFSSVQRELDNPYGELTKRGYKQELNTQINSNLKVVQDLDFWSWSKGLKIHGLIAFDIKDYQGLSYKIGGDGGNSTWKPSGTKTGDVWNSDVLDENGNIKLEEVYVGTSSMSISSARNSYRTFYAEGALNYNRTFGFHNVTGLILTSMKNYRDPNSDNLYKILPYKQLGVSSRFTYSYNDRYFAEANAGYTGSENFSPNNRMGFFPAMAVGWIPSNEIFWDGLSDVISFMKIRYSNGLVGNDVMSSDARFGYQTEISSQNGYSIYGTAGTVGNGLGVTKYGYNATWSTIHKQDLGLEMNFMKNSLTVVLDLFKEKRSNIYVSRYNLPLYAGFSVTPAGNIGAVENKGAELSLAYNKQFNKDVFVSMQANFTMNEDKVIEDGKTVYSDQPWRNSVGHNVLARFGYIAEGLYSSEEEIQERNITQFGETYPGQLTKPGDIKYKDISGDGHIDEQDISCIGNGDVPKYYYGFGGDVRYKNWGLGILFQGTAGADRVVNGSGIWPFQSSSGGGTLLANITDRWSEDNPTNDNVFYPRLAWGSDNPSNVNNFVTSTWWLKDVSFLRLKQFTLSYYFPKTWTNKLSIEGGRFYLMGSNVFTWSAFKLWDPELNSDNGAAYPNVTAYTMGINFSF
ncbi:MAG: TonB-dependent receptor [Paludibacter sp.]|nr:TonB-dependent receptor [Paludibacter sp.]